MSKISFELSTQKDFWGHSKESESEFLKNGSIIKRVFYQLDELFSSFIIFKLTIFYILVKTVVTQNVSVRHHPWQVGS